MGFVGHCSFPPNSATGLRQPILGSFPLSCTLPVCSRFLFFIAPPTEKLFIRSSPAPFLLPFLITLFVEKADKVQAISHCHGCLALLILIMSQPRRSIVFFCEREDGSFPLGVGSYTSSPESFALIIACEVRAGVSHGLSHLWGDTFVWGVSILWLTESLKLWVLCVWRKEGPGRCSAKGGTRCGWKLTGDRVASVG